MNNEITFIDPFAGIGGFRLGLEKSGEYIQGQSRNRKSLQSQGNKPSHKAPRPKGKPVRRESKDYLCVWSNEWDKYCAKIYEKNFGEKPDIRDIRIVPSRDIPDHDLLCAGFPCQSFSIAGKRAGFEDTRGTLFFEIARIARDKRPRYLLLENVKGLLSHQQGKTFQTILGVLADLGYGVEWQVLNSKNFGVPQNRERVFIVGHLGGEGGSQVFPLGEGDGISKEEHGEASSRNEVATALTKDYHKAPLNRGETYLKYIGAIMTKKNKKRLEDGKNLSRNFPQGQRVYSANGVATSLASQAGGLGAKTGLYAVSPCIRAEHHNTADVHFIGNFPKIRRLTPVECERLQGFPDGWTEGVSDTQRYRMLGNAVTVNVVEAIGKRLREVLYAEG